MKTSLLDKSVAIGVVAATFVALIALWAPRLEGAAEGRGSLRGPITLEAEAGCVVELPQVSPLPPMPSRPASPSRRGFWL